MSSGAVVRRVAIVGAGTMGVDIGALFAAKGVPVHFVIRPSPQAETLPARVAGAAEQIGARAGDLKLQVDTDLAALPWQEIELVIESVAEHL